jgi:hypothetical protein
VTFRWADARPRHLAAAPPNRPNAMAAVPSPRGGMVLAFVFVALVEYWLAPAFLGITNYAGAWSAFGYVLFAGFVAAVAVCVLLPLRQRLQVGAVTVAERRLFHGLWSVSLLVALFATRTVFPDEVLGPSSPGATATVTTVYTPFGAWPSLALDDPSLGVAASLNVAILTVLGLLAVTWSAAFVLQLHERRLSCSSSPAAPSDRAARWAALGVWGPLGFVSGCASCSPLYLALLGIAAPSTVAGGYAFLPLVPWIGLSGLLEIASLALALAVLHRVTARPHDGGDAESSEGRAP